jgi:protein-S-isoprenylcysteine O-methyltransferase Ste14
MGRVGAAVASTVHFVAAPGVVVGLVPWLVTGWQPLPTGSGRVPIVALVAGGVLTTVGVAVLVAEFLRFAVVGRGSPAPVAPTERLVVSGLYRYVRNPMYDAVIVAVAGQALLFGSIALVGYGAAMALLMWSFVRLYEEPHLRRQFGEQYQAYRACVPGWLPVRRAR